jgi:hypothetical protein
MVIGKAIGDRKINPPGNGTRRCMRDEAVQAFQARMGYLRPIQTPPPQQLTKY